MFKKQGKKMLAFLLIASLGLQLFSFVVIPETANAAVITKGKYGEAGVIGWDGDADGVTTFMDGSYYVRDGKDKKYGFGIYNDPSTLKWENHSGYLPALVTEFERDGAQVSITNFGDKVTIPNDPAAALTNVSQAIQQFDDGKVSEPAETGAFITMEGQASPSVLNLTAEGELDWLHIGGVSESDWSYKRDVVNSIQYTPANPVNMSQQKDNQMKVSWIDGKPVQSVTDSTYGATFVEAGNGWELKVPAGKQAKVLTIYTESLLADSILEAYLSDQSVPLVKQSIPSVGTSQGKAYAITFQAASDNQELIVKMAIQPTSQPGGAISLNAATLSLYEKGEQPPKADAYMDLELQNPPRVLDLTQEGALDWMHMGGASGVGVATDVNRKKDVQEQIGYLPKDPAMVKLQKDNKVEVGWTDGKPLEGTSNSINGAVYVNVGNGWEITAPADKQTKELRIYTGAWHSSSTLEVYLSDNSVPLVQEKLEAAGSVNGKVLAIKFQAASDNQKLTVKLTIDKTTHKNGNVYLNAVTLSEGKRSDLLDRIAEAKVKLRSAVAGDQPGQYPQASIDAFRSAIQRAEIAASRDGKAQAEYVAVYSRVSIHNPGTQPIQLDPAPTAGLIPLTSNSHVVEPGTTVYHDYVTAVDRFGQSYHWPLEDELLQLGSYDVHFNHMKDYWESKLNKIVKINQLPDERLINAYKAGYIYTHIIKDGYKLNVGENGYDKVYDHDTIGIVAALFTMGDYENAKNFLSILPAQLQFDDAKWKYSWPFAIYLLKTGDVDFIRENFEEIKVNTHKIESDRMGPDGIIKVTYAIDSWGNWVVDDMSALMGLLSYKYLAERLGETSEVAWAETQYDSLLNAVNTQLEKTMKDNNINYIPCSMVEPNSMNRCNDPRDANWASMFLFGRWQWDGYLFNGEQNGVILDQIDETYDYGFDQLKDIYPKYNFGGYPHGWFSSSYNAGYGSAALRGEKHRDVGIRAYQFMIDQTMSAPFGWWEGIHAPSDTIPWEGTRPLGGGGSSPHMWGQSVASKVLFDSLISEKIDGTLIIGRGVPSEWADAGQVIDVSDYPIANNKRFGFRTESKGNKITLTLSGDQPDNEILFNLPLFKNNIAAASTGVVDQEKGEVRLSPSTTSVTITLKDNDDTAKPTWPNAKASATNVTKNSLSLNWTPASDDVEVLQYKVTWGNQSRIVPGNETTINVTGLSAGTSYSFRIEASDAGGNWSDDGPSVSVQTWSDSSTGPGGNPGGTTGENNGENNGGDPSGNTGGTASELKDIKNHWAASAIEKAARLGIVRGYGDGHFYPNRSVKRGEFAVMLSKALKLSDSTAPIKFKDTESIPEWAKSAVSAAANAGILNGYEDHTFRPSHEMSRVEMAVIAVKALNLPVDPKASLTFADANGIPVWAQPYVAAVIKAGLMKGKGNNRFAPNETATRAEAVTLLLTMKQHMES